VEWTPADRHGNRELQDLPEDLVRLFSKRSDQIDPEVERLESSGRERTPRLVKWAVHATRKPKEHEAPDTLYGRWRTEAAERGQDPDTLVRQVTGRTREQDLVVSEGTVAEVFDRLAGPDGLTAQASTFARQDVLAAVGGQLAGASRAELEDLADRFCTERAVAVVADRALEERRWSTPDLLARRRARGLLAPARLPRAGCRWLPARRPARRSTATPAGDGDAGLYRDWSDWPAVAGNCREGTGRPGQPHPVLQGTSCLAVLAATILLLIDRGPPALCASCLAREEFLY
jgi:hypothetical protein